MKRLHRRRSQSGIIFPIMVALVLMFIVVTVFFFFTPMVSGFFNIFSVFAGGLPYPSVSAFILPFMQGYMMIWMSAIVIFIITILAFLALSAQKDEPVD